MSDDDQGRPSAGEPDAPGAGRSTPTADVSKPGESGSKPGGSGAARAWPAHLDVGAVRFARPTSRYDEILAFYRDDLELPVLAAWRGHDGYDGVVFGLPGTAVQMEITQHGTPPVIPEPHPENQLVLYLRGPEARDAAVARLAERGHRTVAPANPYWERHGAAVYADPDGWTVVLAPWVFGERPPPGNA